MFLFQHSFTYDQIKKNTAGIKQMKPSTTDVAKLKKHYLTKKQNNY